MSCVSECPNSGIHNANSQRRNAISIKGNH
jgi:hypothetical protein